MRTGYALPFFPCEEARRCTAPAHFLFHNVQHALDFYLPIGTPICAIEDGVVIKRESRYSKSGGERLRRKGNAVCIRHADGRVSVYAHLLWRSVVVQVGELVWRGQVIAQSGMTGYANYPHLHFGLYDVDNKNIRATFAKPLPPKVSWKRYVK